MRSGSPPEQYLAYRARQTPGNIGRNMTLRAFPAAFLSTAALLAGSPGARAEAPPQESSIHSSARGERVIELAQVQFKVQDNNKDQDKDGKGKKPPAKKPPPDKGAPPAAKQQQQQQFQMQKENAQKQKQLQMQQARDKAQQQKQQADQARQNAIKQKQLEMQQAKDKAQQQKLQADQARQNAIKQKQIEMQQAKEKAGQQKQFEFQKAKDKADKQKRDADAARQDAIRQQQFEIQQAKDKAAKQKLEADQARQNAIKQKQLEMQQAKDRANQPNKQQFDVRAGSPTGSPLKFNRGMSDQEFKKARERAQRQQAGGQGRGDVERWRAGSDKKFEDYRRERKTREVGNRNFIIEPDKRVIVRNDRHTYIRHDESLRLNKVGRELRRERRKNGTLMVVTMGLAGALIYSLQDDDGRILRRTRRDRDGREIVLLDNRRYYGHGDYSPFGPERYYDSYVELPPPRIGIPRDKYIVEYDQASPDDVYDALNAPPVEELGRGYSLDEVRRSYPVLERMRRVDLDSINFDFGSWDVGPDQYSKLERIGRAMQRILDRSPGEIFLIEGHTDAVGSEIDNLSLSDRRAESVALILSEEFRIPPENLTTQGYGEQHLKVLTEDPSRINRRVSVRRITPLLSREGWNDPD